MRTLEEQAERIRVREQQLRRQRHRRITVVLSSFSVLCCIVLVISAARLFPYIEKKLAETPAGSYGAVFAGDPAAGFIIVIIIAFLLGICVALLGMNFKKSRNRRDSEGDSSHREDQP